MAASVLVASSAASTVSDISPWAAVGPQASAFVFEEYDAAHRAAAAAAAAAPAPNAAASAAAEETGSDRDDDDGDGAATAVSHEGGLSTRQVRKLLKGTNIYFQAASPRDVVLVNAVESGCSVVHKEERADLIWIEAQPRTTAFVRQLHHERINFLPGMRSAAQKCHFSNLIRRVAKMYPGDFPFIPRTFAMPFDAAEFKEYAEEHPKTVFVVKPDGGCGGEGIYLTDDAQNVRHPECVVQTYLQNPLTIGGLKFDFRLYVLVTSIAPLRFYLHREGLARMATQPYEPACKANFHKLNMHLTNYSLNKFSSDFVDNTAADDDAHTTKRKASTAFRQLQAEYGEDFDADDVWESITELVGVTLGVIAPHILAAVGEVPGRSNYLSRCYQLLGFDVLLDTNFKPHLLEINGHPSLQTDAPIDLFVKSQVVSPMIRMVSLDARRNRRALAGRFPFVAPSSAEAAAWEDGFTSDSGFVAFDASRGQAITARYIAPLMPMLKHFIECCGGYTGAAYDVMSSTRFARTARSLGIAGPGKIFSTPEIDLLFIKLVKKGSGGNALDFYDYLDAMLGPIGDRLSPNTVPGSLARLRDVTQQLL